ncbi:DUF2806 domain-containing protein [Oscillospiraceae bacterium LTW-04]|nr:DUF2806 domain-containing protein [Oscillospiraceae bacterium MB24-C1]
MPGSAAPSSDALLGFGKEFVGPSSGLINKIACFGLNPLIPWLAKRSDEEEAVKSLRHSLEAMDMDPLMKAAMIATARQNLNYFLNQSSIIEKAIPLLHETERSQDVDEEWLSRFLDGAKHVSSDEVRTIWANILASECNEPGTIPKSILAALASIEIETARAFEILAKFVIQLSPYGLPNLVIDWNQNFVLRKFGVSFADILELSRIGLVSWSNENGFNFDVEQVTFKLPLESDFCHTFVYDVKKPHHKFYTQQGRISRGNVVFTPAGLSLYQTLTVEPLDATDFMAYLNTFAESYDLLIK